MCTELNFADFKWILMALNKQINSKVKNLEKMELPTV